MGETVRCPDCQGHLMPKVCDVCDGLGYVVMPPDPWDELAAAQARLRAVVYRGLLAVVDPIARALRRLNR